MGINFISIGRLRLVGRSKNSRSHFKLILRCFWFIIGPHTKFHPNRTKNTQVRNFSCLSVLVSRAGRSKNGRRHFKLFLSCFCFIFSPRTKFHPNRTKKIEVKQIWYRSALVGWSGQSKNSCIHFKLILSYFCSVVSSHAKYHPNRTKNTGARNLARKSVGRFWLVGQVVRKMIVGISNSFFLIFAPLLAPMPNFIQIRQKK